MIKRASTILLTLFLLLTSAQVWGETSSTTFQKKDGVTATEYTLSDIQITPPFITEISTNYQFDSRASDTNGKYKVTSSGAQFSYKNFQEKNNFVTFYFSNLTTISPDNKYTLTFSIDVNGSSHDGMKFKRALSGGTITNLTHNGNNDAWGEANNEYIEVKKCGTVVTFTIEFTANKSSGSFKLFWEYQDKPVNFVTISKVTLDGVVTPCIVSSNGNNICMGEENTFTAVGLSGNITWSMNGNILGTGTTYTGVFFGGGTIQASNGIDTPLTYDFTTTLCCAVNADLQFIHVQSFDMPNTNEYCEVVDLHDENFNGYDIKTSYDYSYNNCGGEGCGPKTEGYLIGKNSNQFYMGWYSANYGGHNIVGTTGGPIVNGVSRDGYMLVNCGAEAFDATEADPTKGLIFEYDIEEGICDNTMYDFSAQICNLDFKLGNPDENAIKVRFRVVGINADDSDGDLLLDYATQEIDVVGEWRPYGRSFDTKDYTQIRLKLYNDLQNAILNGTDVRGNDVGIDDIKFSRCTPRINPYFNADRTENTLAVCNQGNQTVTIYAGHPSYGITNMITSPSYVLLQSKNGGNWEVVDKITDYIDYGYGVFSVDIANEQPTTQYAAFVGSTEALANTFIQHVENTATNNYESLKNSFSTGSIGCDLYAMTSSTELATFTPSCTNQSETPVVTDYTNCPPSDGKYDLYNSITQVTKDNGDNILTPGMTPEEKRTAINAVGKITFYPVDPNNPTATQPALADNAYIIDYPSSGNSVIYKATFQQTVGGTFTTSAFSDNIVITCLETIEFTMNTESIIGCSGTLDSDDSRTFKIENIEPSSLTSSDINFIWKLKDPITGTYNNITGTEANNTYIVPTTGSGEMQVLIEPKTGSTQACASTTKDLSYNIADNPNFEIESTVVPCKDKLTDDGVVVSLKELSGSTTLKITRTAKDENNIVSTTIFTSFEEVGSFNVINYNEETEFAFIDTYFDAQYFSAGFDVSKIVSVQYNIVLGIETTDCKDEKSTETFGINSTNTFSLKPSENVKDINDDSNIVEYHVCKGGNVTVTSNYREQSGGLQPGEIYEWYVKKGNGEYVLETELEDIEHSKSYTIAEIEETTSIKVVLVEDSNFPGAETCGGEAEITIYVDEKPEVSVENLVLCEGDSDTFEPTGSADSFTWTPATYLSSATATYPIFTAETAGEFEYSLKVTKGVCIVTIEDIKATVNPLPEFVYINVNTNEDGINVLDVEINGNSPYYYSLDGEIYGEENTLPTSLPIGWSVLYVKDKYDCKSSHNFEVEPTPIRPDKFFTPNGDGNNDLWTVENLEIYPSYIIEIFDRHGKRLYIKRVGSFNGDKETSGSEPFGWDGNYNGHQLPSDDYWYLITLEEVRKQYTGHFTLKR